MNEAKPVVDKSRCKRHVKLKADRWNLHGAGGGNRGLGKYPGEISISPFAKVMPPMFNLKIMRWPRFSWSWMYFRMLFDCLKSRLTGSYFFKDWN
jgi:hypothetical protein